MRLMGTIPNWYDHGIFWAIDQVAHGELEWLDDPAIMDTEYYGNRSGMKSASPLVCKMTSYNPAGLLSDEQQMRLARIILHHYKSRWIKSYAALKMDFEVENERALKSTKTHTGTSSKTDNATRTGSGTITDTGETSGTSSGTMDITTSGTRSIDRTDTDTETRNLTDKTTGTHGDTTTHDMTDKTSHASNIQTNTGVSTDTTNRIYPINATGAANVSGSNTSGSSANNTSTTKGSASDNFDEKATTGTVSVSGSEDHTDTHTGTVNRSHTEDTDETTGGTTKETTSGTSSGTSTNTRASSGKDTTEETHKATDEYTDTEELTAHDRSIPQLIKEAWSLYKQDYIEWVYDCVDEILTVPYYQC